MTNGMRTALLVLPIALGATPHVVTAPTSVIGRFPSPSRWAGPASAIRLPHAPLFAAPQVIVANGGPLTHRIVLSDLDENFRLMLAASEVAQVSVSSFRQRPCIRIAMYWGHQWQGKLDLPDSVTAFAAANGAQAGAFCPAFRKQPAMWLFGAYGAAPASPRRVAAEGLAILSRHKIPTTTE